MTRLLLLLCMLATVAMPNGRTLFQAPTANQTHIVFGYADDLWIVPRTGGDAVRLTSGSGFEGRPLFSPDGTMVAFTGQYDGNTDVFVVPATGGVPKRLTWHPAVDQAAGWTPDGKRILFNHFGSAADAKPRMYTVDLNGSFPQEIPLPIGVNGTYSPDGKQLAYMPHERADNAWKRYRGGRAAVIWIANLADSSVVKVPRVDSNDHTPMWIGNRLYFLSDRNGPYTLFSYDPGTKKVAAVLEAKGLDIKSASPGNGVVAYEQFGEIYLYDLKGNKAEKVAITLNGDLGGVRPRMENVSRNIQNVSLSPSGVRVAFEARGDIFTVPAEKGDVRNLTRSTGIADRNPSWSPDGKWIAYFSDESGEYQLCLRDQTGLGEVKKISLAEKPAFYYNPTWSPDSKKIAYTDNYGQIWYLELEKKQPVKIDATPFELMRFSVQARWSPDSEWLLYNRPLKSMVTSLFVYSLATGKSTQITDGRSDARYGVWDKNGKYIYFASSTDIAQNLMGFDMSARNRPMTRSLYMIVLSKDEKNPLAPESDEEKVVEEKKPEEKKAEEKKDAAKKVEVKIDFDNILQRTLPLPVPPRNYDDLEPGKTGILFYLERPVVQAAYTGPETVTLHKFELEKRKSDRFTSNLIGYEVSQNGEKMLIASNPTKMSVVGTGAPPKPTDPALKLEAMEAWVDPKAEWKQMFKEAWRLQRDFFYDAKLHGLDAQAMSERYGLYLENLGSRRDLTYLFNEMFGELSVGHLYVMGGDTFNNAKTVQTGLLGADYKLENGRYRFARVYEGDNWSPQTRAPLTQPGVNVVTGEYLLAVDGRELKDTDNVYSFFEAKAGKSVVLKVGPNPTMDGARDVTVVPLDNEVGIRTLAWTEDNRKKVDQLSGGKLAYMHIPDTTTGGYVAFNRHYFSQRDKQGVIIDERFNHGGQAADYIIEHLRRPIYSYWTTRNGEVYSTPGLVIQGPKVMIANEYSGSGGDYLPWMFKRAKLGPLVGKRTWGGLVGIGGYPSLIDGGMVTAPHFRFFTPEGKWEVENHGTDVDYDVDLDPKAWREGHDTQLEKAVDLAMAELKRNPPVVPKRPETYPDFHTKKPAGAAAAKK